MQIDSTEAKLISHEEICALRYGHLEDKMKTIDQRLDKLELEIKEVKTATAQGLAEIKALIEKRNNASHTTLISTAGTIIVALIGFLGYLLMHGK